MLRGPESTGTPVLSTTVLVVDDAASARLLVTKTLNSLGFKTIVAADGESALRAVLKFHPDAIVTDLEMPGMDGEQMIEALRNSGLFGLHKLPVIVCSSKIDADTLTKLRELHVDAVVPKPVDVKELARAALRLFETR